MEAKEWLDQQLSLGLRDLTMVPPAALVDLVIQVDRTVEEGVSGAFVECGVWRGGAALLAALRYQLHEDDRAVWMFDSFEGLPPPDPAVDGEAALAWSKDKSSDRYYDNCRAEYAALEQTVREFELQRTVRIVPGWFDATIPQAREAIGDIAILRIDGDWYSSVATCLDELGGAVSPGGVTIIDDYYTWDGCSRAVHEYLSRRDSDLRIWESAGTAVLAPVVRHVV